MELFSEIYSSYYRAIEALLRSAHSKPLSEKEVQHILQSHTFAESSLQMMPKLQSGDWPLLRQTAQGYQSACGALPDLPMTRLQKAWLCAISEDPRMRLFLEADQVAALQNTLQDTAPLYQQQDFYVFDQALDGDDYQNEIYQAHFKTMLAAIRNRSAVQVQYDGARGSRIHGDFWPYRMEYSQKDDKFRVHCLRRQGRAGKQYTLNMSRIVALLPIQGKPEIDLLPQRKNKSARTGEVVLEITRERNTLERTMVQFAHLEKRTEYDENTDTYHCTLRYPMVDETEVLIRILSFGPTVRVVEPPAFALQMQQRVQRQLQLMAEW